MTQNNNMKTLFTSLLLCLGTLAFGQSLDTGIKLYKSKQYAQATSTLKAIKSSDPAYAKARYYLGRVAFDQEEYGEAREFFKAATKADDSQADYFTWLGNAIGTIAQDAGKLRQASLAPKIKNAYKKAVALDPSSLDAQWGLIEFYTQAPGFMGGSWEKAEEAARAIMKIDKAEGHDALATVFLRKEEPELAAKEYEALLKVKPEQIGSVGIFYQNQGWYDKAFNAFQKGFEQFPENYPLLYQVGRTSALSGQKAELGIESLERYMAEAPADVLPSKAAAKMRLAMIYEKQGDKSRAIALYEQSLKEDPELELAKEGLKRVK